MKRTKKTNSQTRILVPRLPAGIHETRVVSKSQVRKKATGNTFTAMETGQPDQDHLPDSDNPLAVQGGLGPLNQDGEGERQNDQLAELEQIEPAD
jgi:hypothetical protein